MNWSHLKNCLIDKLQCKKGFTLIEILVVLSITGIVILSVGNFLVENIRLFESENDLLTVQDDASKVTKAFEDAALQAEKIKSCKVEEGLINSIVFINGSDEIKIERDGINLKWTKNSVTKTVATNIESIKGIPMVDSSEVPLNGGTETSNSFTEASTNGITLEIKLKLDQQTHTVKQTLYFRNKK